MQPFPDTDAFFGLGEGRRLRGQPFQARGRLLLIRTNHSRTPFLGGAEKRARIAACPSFHCHGETMRFTGVARLPIFTALRIGQPRNKARAPWIIAYDDSAANGGHTVKVFMLRARYLVPAVAAIGVLANPAMAEPSNKWRVEFDEKAQTAGVIVLSVTPIGGTPVRIETQIPADTHENYIAHMVRDALQVKLGAAYDVEVDDGEDVLIKKEADVPDFELQLVKSTATGLNIELERE
jgi:hypothetical protein